MSSHRDAFVACGGGGGGQHDFVEYDFKASLKKACRRVLGGTPRIVTLRVSDLEQSRSSSSHTLYETFITLPNGLKYVSLDLYPSIEETENALCAAIMNENEALTPVKREWHANQRKHLEFERQQEARAKRKAKHQQMMALFKR